MKYLTGREGRLKKVISKTAELIAYFIILSGIVATATAWAVAMN